MTIEVKLAETREEREAVYRLRYQVYIEEMNRPCTTAIHSQKFVTDAYDPAATIVSANRDGHVVGTVRSLIATADHFEFPTEYTLFRFEHYYPANLATTGMLIVTREHRKTRLTTIILRHIYSHGRERGTAFDFINVNGHLLPFYERLGYRRYKTNFQHPEYGEVTPLVLILEDIAHLRKVRSPFVECAQRFNNTSESTEFFRDVILNGANPTD